MPRASTTLDLFRLLQSTHHETTVSIGVFDTSEHAHTMSRKLPPQQKAKTAAKPAAAPRHRPRPATSHSTLLPPTPQAHAATTTASFNERTYHLLLTHAMRLVRRQQIPSVAELAVAAGVSRATAYRYFPSRSKLISTVVAESLKPVRSFEPSSKEGGERLSELFEKTFPLFVEFEPHMRAALQLSLEHDALSRSGRMTEEPFRRGYRREILGRTLAPLKSRLEPDIFDRLIKAVSIFYGIEPYVVLKDIWGSSNQEVEEITRWMMAALLRAALSESRSVPL